MGSTSSRIQYEVVDVLETVTGKEQESILVLDEASGETYRWYKQVWSFLVTEQKVFIFIILSIVGAVSAVVCFLIDFTISEMYNVVEMTLVSFGPVWLNYFVYVLYSVVFCVLSALVVVLVSPYSVGSGIPEMKSILSGINVPQYLSAETMVAKILSLVTAFAGGLSIGKEGPLVHISACIAEQVLRVPLWKKIAHNQSLRFQIISAACAVGVSTSFGAPVGGVLFSVEVTSTYYLVENLWKAFWCAMCGTLVIRLLAEFGLQVGLITLFRLNGTGWEVSAYNWQELGVFALVGIGGGILGAIFIKCVKYTMSFCSKVQRFRGTKGAIVRVLLTGVLVALITYPFVLVRNDQDAIDYLFVTDDREANDIWLLTAMVVVKLVITCLSVGVCNLAAGVYTPLFVAGAAYGRLIGELMAVAFSGAYFEISPLTYTVVGAAAVCASATHTVSTAVIVAELTGQFDLMLPLLLTVLMAEGIGKLLSKRSIYDELLQLKGLPYMPGFEAGSSNKNLTAQDIMQSDDSIDYLTLNSTYRDARELANKKKVKHYTFPLTESKESMILLGSVKRKELLKVLASVKRVQKEIAEQEERWSKSKRQRTRSFTRFLSIPGADPSRYVPNLPHIDNLEDQLSEEAPDHCRICDEEHGEAHEEHEKHDERMEEEEDGADVPLEAPIWSQVLPYVFTSAQDKQDFTDVVIVDPTSFQVAEQLSLSKIHFMFTMLGLRDMYVTTRGRLMGIITKNDVVAHLRADQ